jgi:sterol desaturase/sphingolipid hydroxylase (fatty acid hydroxylase superfamily)
MDFWISDQVRLFVLVALCGLLWSLEYLIPLNRYDHRLKRVLPNVALTVLLVLTNLLLSFWSAQVAGFIQTRQLGLFSFVKPSPVLLAILGLVALDCFAYFAHLLLHKSWLGWQFHRVHHSEREVNVTTAFRQHPGETLWRILWQILAVVVFGLPLWVVVIYLLVSAVNAQFEHANMRVCESLDRFLRLIVVTPNMHKVHHSREQKETDTNYANIFSVWDRLFGTYRTSSDVRRIRYGLDGFDEEGKQTFGALLKTPFVVSQSGKGTTGNR